MSLDLFNITNHNIKSKKPKEPQFGFDISTKAAREERLEELRAKFKNLSSTERYNLYVEILLLQARLDLENSIKNSNIVSKGNVKDDKDTLLFLLESYRNLKQVSNSPCYRANNYGNSPRSLENAKEYKNTALEGYKSALKDLEKKIIDILKEDPNLRQEMSNRYPELKELFYISPQKAHRCVSDKLRKTIGMVFPRDVYKSYELSSI